MLKYVTQYSRSGFTIVELLIVIVVIGILAAITIVAYTGITTQANQKTALGNAQSVKSVADTYYSEKGAYPAVSTTGANQAAKDANTLSNLNAGNYSKVPAGVTITGAGVIGASNNNVLYAVKSDGSGACFGYIPSGGSFTGSGANATVLFSGSASALTNATTPSCT